MTAPNVSPPLAGVVQRYQRSIKRPERRRPGRPLKRTVEYLRTLLETHKAVVTWFVTEYGTQPASDRALYTAYFAREFESTGQRAGRANTPDFQGALKTLRNELAEARRLDRTNPGNGHVSGTT